MQFGPPSDEAEAVVTKVKIGKPQKKKREKAKIDPQLISKARELRDRYLEQVNVMPMLEAGKYAVHRALQVGQVGQAVQMRQAQLPGAREETVVGNCLGSRVQAA